jgi:hypothetical protein
MYYKKISIDERLPELGKFVTTIDEAGEHIVYRLTEYGWNMRDMSGVNSPNNNLKILYWLEEIDLSEIEIKARKWDELDKKIASCYVDENGELLYNVEIKGCSLIIHSA